MTALAVKAETTSTQQAIESFKAKMNEMEPQVSESMLIEQNEGENAVLRSVERFHKNFFSGFEELQKRLLTFSGVVNTRNNQLEKGSVSVPSRAELNAEDVRYRNEYYAIQDSSEKVSEFVKHLARKVSALGPTARAFSELPKNPDFHKQILVVDTLASLRQRVANELLGQASSLSDTLKVDLQTAHDRVGQFNKLTQNDGKPLSTLYHMRAYSFDRPTAEGKAKEASPASVDGASSSSAVAAATKVEESEPKVKTEAAASSKSQTKEGQNSSSKAGRKKN